MSTLRITNIEAKADPSSPTVDEKIKLTNSNGDILVHIDGKTSGITTIGINTTAGNIKFDQNSNVVVTGIITATKFVGTIEPTSLEIGSNIKLGNAGVITATSYVGDGSALTGIDATQIQTGNTSVQTVDTGSNGHVKINTEGTERLRITSAGKIGIGTDNPGERLHLTTTSGNCKLRIDAASAASVDFYNSGTRFSDMFTDAGTGNFTITNRQNADIIFRTNGSNERVYIKSSGEVSIGGFTPGAGAGILQIAGGLRVAGSASASDTTSPYIYRTSGSDHLNIATSGTERLRITSNGMVRVTDSASLSFGNNDDMRIFHDGGNANYIDVYNKDLYIRCNKDAGITGGDIVLQPKSGENSAIFRDNGAVELYYDNAKKIETKSDGITVTGGIYLDGSGGTGSANKLDDYEEGTWSPNVGGNASYDIQWGYYVKVGSLVHCWGGLRTQTLGTGNARVINNLPFTAVSSPSSTQTGGGSVVWHDNAPNNIINTPAIAVTPNTTNSFINAKTSGSGALQDHVDFWQNNHRANFFITYYTTV